MWTSHQQKKGTLKLEGINRKFFGYHKNESWKTVVLPTKLYLLSPKISQVGPLTEWGNSSHQSWNISRNLQQHLILRRRDILVIFSVSRNEVLKNLNLYCHVFKDSFVSNQLCHMSGVSWCPGVSSFHGLAKDTALEARSFYYPAPPPKQKNRSWWKKVNLLIFSSTYWKVAADVEFWKNNCLSDWHRVQFWRLFLKIRKVDKYEIWLKPPPNLVIFNKIANSQSG